MSIKEKIHIMIEKVEDDSVLQKIYSLIEQYVDTDDAQENLTKEQIARLKAARESAHKGRTHSLSEVKEQVKIWLSK